MSPEHAVACHGPIAGACLRAPRHAWLGMQCCEAGACLRHTLPPTSRFGGRSPRSSMQSRGQRTRKRRRGVDQAVPADGGAAEVCEYPPRAARTHAAVRAADLRHNVHQASRRTRSRPGAADAAGGGDAAGAGSSSLLSSVMRGAESLFSGREGTNAQDSAKPTASVGNAWEQAAASQGAGDGGVGMSQLSEADLVDHSLACLGDIQISTPCVCPLARRGPRDEAPEAPSPPPISRQLRAARCDGPPRARDGRGAGAAGLHSNHQLMTGRGRAKDRPAWTERRRTRRPLPRRSPSARPTLRARFPSWTLSALSRPFRWTGPAHRPRTQRAARWLAWRGETWSPAPRALPPMPARRLQTYVAPSMPAACSA